MKNTVKKILSALGLLTLMRRIIPRLRRKPKSFVGSDPFKLHQSLIKNLYPDPPLIAVGSISGSMLQRIETAIADGTIERCDLLEMSDRSEAHLYLKVDQHSESVERVSANNQTVLALHRFDASDPLLAALHHEVRAIFRSSVGSPFVIVNSRMWVSKPGGEQQGPNSFHSDGFAPGHLKAMIYVTPLSIEDGYFEYVEQRKLRKLVDLPAGTAVLFQNSELVHRGVPGTSRERISIELTLMRSLVEQEQSWPGHFYGRHLCEPTISTQEVRAESGRYDKSSNYSFRHVESGLKVNIGSGRRNWDGWTCFDEIDHQGVTRLKFSPAVTLPLEDQSSSLIYSSHCFEHLDEPTVKRVMSEIERISLSGAVLVLKIPDYDYFHLLGRSEMTFSTLMDDKGIESVVDTWTGRVDDTFMNRVAMMFCGYWNAAHGEHFLGSGTRKPGAFHGPPMIGSKQLREIFRQHEPSEIAQKLRAQALLDPEFARFNHQSAWNRAEMTEFLSLHGFEVISTSTDVVCQRFRGVIPDLAEMQPWSAYFLAKRI